MFRRLLFTHAATLTAVGGLATIRIVRCRRALSRSLAHMPCTLHTTARSALATTLAERLNLTTWLLTLLGLALETFGWLIGVAWTDCVVAHFHAVELPTLDNTARA
jgi:hypothetical protein